MEVVLLVLALTAGGLLAVQAAANLQLSKAVGGPIAASPLQLGIAAALLATVAAGLGTLTALGELGDVTPWHLAGGLASPLYITAGMLLFPRLGAVTSVGLFIAGQMLASLLLDGFGLIGVPDKGFGLWTLLGATAVAAGTVAIVRAQTPPPNPPTAHAPAPDPQKTKPDTPADATPETAHATGPQEAKPSTTPGDATPRARADAAGPQVAGPGTTPGDAASRARADAAGPHARAHAAGPGTTGDAAPRARAQVAGPQGAGPGTTGGDAGSGARGDAAGPHGQADAAGPGAMGGGAGSGARGDAAGPREAGLGTAGYAGAGARGQVAGSLGVKGGVGAGVQVAGRAESGGAVMVGGDVRERFRGSRKAAGPGAGWWGRLGWILLGLGAGGGLPVQAAVNARLRAELDAPVTAAAVSFTVATLAAGAVLMVLVVTRRGAAPKLGGLPAMPWWGWLGGFAAAVYVTVSLMAIPEIGAATTVALTVAGQQLASVSVDHYGLMRLPRRTVGGVRLAGVAALLAGAALIQLA